MGMGIMKVRDREDAGFLRHLPSSVLGLNKQLKTHSDLVE